MGYQSEINGMVGTLQQAAAIDKIIKTQNAQLEEQKTANKRAEDANIAEAKERDLADKKIKEIISNDFDFVDNLKDTSNERLKGLFDERFQDVKNAEIINKYYPTFARIRGNDMLNKTVNEEILRDRYLPDNSDQMQSKADASLYAKYEQMNDAQERLNSTPFKIHQTVSDMRNNKVESDAIKYANSPEMMYSIMSMPANKLRKSEKRAIEIWNEQNKKEEDK